MARGRTVVGRPPIPGHRTVPTPVTAAPPRLEVRARQNGFCFSHSKHFQERNPGVPGSHWQRTGRSYREGTTGSSDAPAPLSRALAVRRTVQRPPPWPSPHADALLISVSQAGKLRLRELSTLAQSRSC